MDKRII